MSDQLSLHFLQTYQHSLNCGLNCFFHYFFTGIANDFRRIRVWHFYLFFLNSRKIIDGVREGSKNDFILNKPGEATPGVFFLPGIFFWTRASADLPTKYPTKIFWLPRPGNLVTPDLDCL